MKFDVIVADPPWTFDDTLTMSTIKRGAASQYSVLDFAALQALDVASITNDKAALALWTPSSLIPEGLGVMQAWGFEFKQTYIWVKTKKEPLRSLLRDCMKAVKTEGAVGALKQSIPSFSVDFVLGFGMGRLFRQTHEVVLLGIKGKIYDLLDNKSQRSVSFHPATKHSAKPENLQDSLDLMFPNANKLEMFARRDRKNWTCVGNQCPSSFDEDIRDSIIRLQGL